MQKGRDTTSMNHGYSYRKPDYVIFPTTDGRMDELRQLEAKLSCKLIQQYFYAERENDGMVYGYVIKETQLEHASATLKKRVYLFLNIEVLRLI